MHQNIYATPREMHRKAHKGRLNLLFGLAKIDAEADKPKPVVSCRLDKYKPSWAGFLVGTKWFCVGNLRATKRWVGSLRKIIKWHLKLFKRSFANTTNYIVVHGIWHLGSVLVWFKHILLIDWRTGHSPIWTLLVEIKDKKKERERKTNKLRHEKKQQSI